MQTQKFNFVVGEVGAIPPRFDFFIASAVPQEVLVVDFLFTASNTNVIPTLAFTPENKAGTEL